MQFSFASLSKRIRLFHLQILSEVYKQGSILAASRSLHISQPAISKVIHDLEEYFEQPLFIRTSQGMTPTDFSLMLNKHCNELQSNLHHLVDDLNTWQMGISGKVTVGNMLSAYAEFLPKAIIRLKQLAPNVAVSVKVGTNDTLFPELINGTLDIMLGLLPTQAEENLEHIELYDETLSVVVGRQNPIAFSGDVDEWLRAEGITWIIPPLSSAAGQAAQAFLHNQGIEVPKQGIESLSILTNLTVLLESNAVLLTPKTVVDRFVQLGILVELRHSSTSTTCGKVGYSIARNRLLTPACQRFIDLLHENTQP